MRGYKGTNADMTCRGFQYELGKTYTHEGNVELCSSGFHFCKNLISCLRYYEQSESRFFEVETGDAVFSDTEDKGVTNSIRLVREIKGAELNWIIYGNGYGDGDGYGDIYGNGFGDGDGDGNSEGFGDGYGYSINIQEVIKIKE